MPPIAAAIGNAARRGIAQIAGDELALELQTDDEEEDRQQAVRRPRRDGQMQMQRFRPDRELGHCAVGGDHGELAHTRATPAAASSSMPPTVSLRRISENRCDSDHEPRVRSRKLVGIGPILVTRYPRLISLIASAKRPVRVDFLLVRREVGSAVSSPTRERHPVHAHPAVHARTASEFAIHIDRVTKTFGHIVAVDDLSLTVDPGEVFGFLGPNGAGKSTTIRVLLGLIRSDLR